MIKDRELIVASLATLTAEWNSISKQMAWNLRKNLEEAPPLLKHFTGITHITRAEWLELRKEVLTIKRSAAFRKKQYALKHKVETRRDYMRGYMRRYRIRNKKES